MWVFRAATMIALPLIVSVPLSGDAHPAHRLKPMQHHAGKTQRIGGVRLAPQNPAPRNPVSQSSSSNAAENGIGGAGTLNSGGLSFLGPARGGIGH